MAESPFNAALYKAICSMLWEEGYCSPVAIADSNKFLTCFLIVIFLQYLFFWLWMFNHGNTPLCSRGRISHPHCVKSAAEVIMVFERGIIRCKALQACCMILNTCIFASLSTDSMHTLLARWASVSRGGKKGLAHTIGCIHCQESGSTTQHDDVGCKTTM